MLYEIYGYMWESLGHFLQATAIRLTGTDRNPFDMSRHESTSCRHPIDTPLTEEGGLKTEILNGSGRQGPATIPPESAYDFFIGILPMEK